MVKVFFDTNVFIDVIEERKNINLDQFASLEIFISPLSIHILTYLYKYKIPNKKLSDSIGHFIVIPFNDFIANKALSGPTADFEDNVQLHSAAQANCDLFLTNDEKLLKLRLFGKVQLAPVHRLNNV